MIVETRTYTIAAELRQRFLDLCETRARPLARAVRKTSAAILICAIVAPALAAAPAEPRPPANLASAPRDGAHDFDWEIGSWTTRLRYLPEPLTGSNRWLEYSGTSDVRAVLGGRANLVELSVAGTAGRIEGASLRLYNPKARQWTLNFANIRNGQLTAPVYGAFDANGRGLFYGVDTVDGRAVLVRFVISDVTPNSARFEQAYSADAGATWEVNWIAVDTRR